MTKYYKVFHREQTNHPNFIYLHNFHFLDEVIYTYCFKNSFKKTSSLVGKWNIKYKTTWQEK